MSKLIVFIAATFLASAAMAGDDPYQNDKSGMYDKSDMSSAATFESLDKNSDSQISKTEAASDESLADSFASVDTNGDGYLSKAEFAATKRPRS